MPLKSNYISNKKNSIYWLSFFLFSILITVPVFAGEKDTVSNQLTVVKVVSEKTKPYSIVTFSESQRFYKILKRPKNYSACINLLKWSAKYKQPIVITRRTEYSDTILSVKKYKIK